MFGQYLHRSNWWRTAQKESQSEVTKKKIKEIQQKMYQTWAQRLHLGSPSGCGCLLTLEWVQYIHFHRRLSFGIYKRWRNKNLCSFPPDSILVAHSHKTSTSIFSCQNARVEKVIFRQNETADEQKRKKYRANVQHVRQNSLWWIRLHWQPNQTNRKWYRNTVWSTVNLRSSIIFTTCANKSRRTHVS